MMALVLAACPTGLRGDLTKWLYEVSAGVFIGTVNSRLREQIWQRVTENAGTGRAILIWSSRNEQKLNFAVNGHRWEPIDIDGVTLMRRPAEDNTKRASNSLKPGWSKASISRRTQRMQQQRLSEGKF